MSPFEKAANLMMDVLEEEFHIIPVTRRDSTIQAVVNIMEHYAVPKTPAQLKNCSCQACERTRAQDN